MRQHAFMMRAVPAFLPTRVLSDKLKQLAVHVKQWIICRKCCSENHMHVIVLLFDADDNLFFLHIFEYVHHH